jgi:uncharacterized RDD family membrane protein YckC
MPWPGTLPTSQQAALRYALANRLLPTPQPHGYMLAPISARFMARVIDILVVLGLNIVVNGWFVVQYLREIAPIVDEAQRRFLADGTINSGTPSNRATWLEFTIFGVAIALWFAYEVPAIAATGQTLGKRIMRIRVMRFENDEPLGIGRAWRRWNPLGLPVLLWSCCGVGFLLQGADLLVGLLDRPLHQAMHDRHAGTVVVQVPTRQPGSPAAGQEPKDSAQTNADGDPRE